MSKDKVFILLSGGIDSTTVLAFAKNSHPDAEFEAVTIDYGQRHRREIQAAADICEVYDIPHVVLDLKGLMTGMLVDKGEQNEAVPDVSYDELPKGISPTYVSFRNGLMLSALAARAQTWVMQQQHDRDAEVDALGADGHTEEAKILQEEEFNAFIYCGVHADDAANWAYPDCTPEFIGGMANAIFIGTYNRVRLKSPFAELDKTMIVTIGVGLKVPYELTWSCYKGGDEHCGTCPTCRSRKDAFFMARKGGLQGLKDPTSYAE